MGDQWKIKVGVSERDCQGGMRLQGRMGGTVQESVLSLVHAVPCGRKPCSSAPSFISKDVGKDKSLHCACQGHCDPSNTREQMISGQ